jgi:hypothetical protein
VRLFLHSRRAGPAAALFAALWIGATAAQEARKVEVGKPAPAFLLASPHPLGDNAGIPRPNTLHKEKHQ